MGRLRRLSLSVTDLDARISLVRLIRVESTRMPDSRLRSAKLSVHIRLITGQCVHHWHADDVRKSRFREMMRFSMETRCYRDTIRFDGIVPVPVVRVTSG